MAVICITSALNHHCSAQVPLHTPSVHQRSPSFHLSMNSARHRSISGDSISPKVPRSLSPPSQTYHRSILPQSVPTPALVESVAGAAHYSGIRVDPDTLKRRHSGHDRRASHTQVKADHHRVMADLKELYACKPTLEIFERSWNKDAVFEVTYIVLG
jgi:hypothetical protein